jgi:ATP-dependent helicase/DNAse subunit B
LKIEPPREPQLGIAVDIKGDLYHRALEIYYSKLVQLDPEQQETTKDDILKAALTQAVSDLSDDPRFSPGPYWENEQKDMLFRLRRFIDFDDKRLERQPAKPAMFEAKFGTEHYEESYPALRLDTQAGQVVIRGRIDRIDVSESVDGQPPCATVIDYKTGSNPISQADAQAGTNLQLPLYALAVSKSIMPGARVSNGHYLSINAAKSIGSIDFAAEKSAGLLEHTTSLVGHAVQSVKSGDFGVRPQSSKACKHCSHKPICRVTDLNHANGEES